MQRQWKEDIYRFNIPTLGGGNGGRRISIDALDDDLVKMFAFIMNADSGAAGSVQ